MTQGTPRMARFETQIAPEVLAIVKHAAEMEGRSVSDFIVSAAKEAAVRMIENNHVIRLSVEDQRQFVDMLLNPPEAVDALKRAKQAHARLIQPSA